ncbi:hypothetical protein LDENG_00132560 [Lucifuga dentata]|nr:hypothetical protein LDENG_00132560 [Lucifuga dentata]
MGVKWRQEPVTINHLILFPLLSKANIKKMSDALCIMGPLFECGSCYQINIGSVVGIIACDIILTILITISVFCFATLQRRREWDSNNSRKNQPSAMSKKMTAEIIESPYQINELTAGLLCLHCGPVCPTPLSALLAWNKPAGQIHWSHVHRHIDVPTPLRGDTALL